MSLGGGGGGVGKGSRIVVHKIANIIFTGLSSVKLDLDM